MAFARKVGGQTTLPVGRDDAADVRGALRVRSMPRVRWSRGAPISISQDPDGTTAMVLAIINGHYDVAAMLLEKGANPNLADTSGMAALYAAVDMNTLPFMHGRPYPRPSGPSGRRGLGARCC